MYNVVHRRDYCDLYEKNSKKNNKKNNGSAVYAIKNGSKAMHKKCIECIGIKRYTN